MAKRIIFFVSVLALLVSATVYAADNPVITLEGRAWFPQLKTDWNVGTNSTDIDKDTLGIGKKDFADIRASWHVNPRHTLRVAYVPIKYTGDATLTQTVKYGDQTFVVGDLVSSDLRMDYVRGGWFWNLVNTENVKFSTLLEMKAFFVKAEMSALNANRSHEYKINVPIPTIGGAVEIKPVKYIALFAEASGIYVGSRGHVYDAEAGVRFAPHKNFALTGGYRIFELKAEDGSDSAKFRMDGPFIGALLTF